VILIDTTPLVALVDPRDTLHPRAVKDLARVKVEPLATCNAVLAEACFLLPHAVQRRRLFRLVRELPVQPFAADSPDPWSPVLEWLEKYAEHAPDWADAELVNLAAGAKNSRIWTYDAEFATTWRDSAGKRLRLFAPQRTRR
jgi:uncharacterized protein